MIKPGAFATSMYLMALMNPDGSEEPTLFVHQSDLLPL